MNRTETYIEKRLAQTRELFTKWEVDGLLISSAVNRRWLSGFTGSNGWLLITHDSAYLATDFRYWEQASEQSPDFELFKILKQSDIQDLLAKHEGARLALESQHVTLYEYKVLEEVKAVEWKPVEQTVEPLRAVKSQPEIELIQQAARITDAAMSLVPQLARPGQSEQELAWQLEKAMREAGADGLAFPVHVASGPNAALPHHMPGERKLQPGDSLIVDMGASVNGYCSDLTRTFYMGEAPDEQFQQLYDLVLQAQTTALEALRPGMTGSEADATARDIIAGAGHADHFGHGLGHGLGLFIHEGPRLSPNAPEGILLQPGMVTTVEPGVYIPQWGGIRIEDLVLLVEGGIEMLSHCPKQPLIPLS